MKEVFINRHGDIRAGWRIALFIFLLSVLSASLVFPLITLGELTEALAHGILATALVVSSFVMMKFVNKKPFTAIGLALRSKSLVDLVMGLLLSFGMIAAIFALEMAAGFIELSGVVSFSDVSTVVLPSILLFTVGAFWEELLFRGYLFQTLIQAITFLPAMLLMVVLFALAHANNPNATWIAILNVALAGSWLSFAYMKTRSLWLPLGLHFGWNFSQTTLFGFPTSGIEFAQYRLLTLSQFGPTWITGGEFGPEGGMLATIALIACTWYVLKSKTLTPPTNIVTLDSVEDLLPLQETHGGSIRNA